MRIGFPWWPSVASVSIDASGARVRRAFSTRSTSSVAWQYARRSTLWNMGGPAEDGFHDLAGPRAECAELPLVHDHVVRRGNDVAETPPEFSRVPHSELRPSRRGVAPLSLPQSLESHFGGGVDRDDLHGLPVVLPEDIELHRAAEAVDQDPFPADAGQG